MRGQITPLRIFITFILVVDLIYYLTGPYHSSDIVSVVPGLCKIVLYGAIPTEIILTILSFIIPRDALAVISSVSIPFVVYVPFAYLNWRNTIDNRLIIPNDYKKDYVIIVFNKPSTKDIDPTISWPRKRVIHVPENGVYYTSTKIESSLDRVANSSILRENGEKLKKPKRFGAFFTSTSDFQGYKYSIIQFSDNPVSNLDSLLMADKINFEN